MGRRWRFADSTTPRTTGCGMTAQGHVRGLHRLRQHARRAPPDGAPADPRQPPLLGERDARRWFPLRPGPGPRAAIRRRSMPVRRSSRRSRRIRSSGRSSSSPNRGISGPDGYQQGAFPAAIRRMEWPLPRHRAPLLARRGRRERPRHPPERIERPLLARARRRNRASTSSRATTGSRCRTSSPTSGSTTWRTASAIVTAPTGTRAATGVSRARPPTRRCSSCARARCASMMATLAFSLGVPMLNQGDELARTQQGNNNPWCQDSALELAAVDSPRRHPGRMLAFTRRVLALRRRYAVFRAARVPAGPRVGRRRSRTGSTAPGRCMTEADWQDRTAACARGAAAERCRRPGNGGAPASATRLLLVLNGGASSAQQHLPAGRWRLMLDTARPGAEGDSVDRGGGGCGRFPACCSRRSATSRSRAP